MGVLYLKGWTNGFEISEIFKIYKILREVIRQKNIETILWKDDTYCKDSYTHLIDFLGMEFSRINFLFMSNKQLHSYKNSTISTVKYCEKYKTFAPYLFIKYNLNYEECFEFTAGINKNDRKKWKLLKENKHLCLKLTVISPICTRVLPCGTREFK